jgi:polysaccharide export outer membrane protein
MLNTSPLGRFLVLLLLIIQFSCTNKRNLIYFQGDLGSTESNKNYDPILKTDDVLSIIVMAIDEVAVKPFNISTSVQNNQLNGGYGIGNPTPPGYLIDQEGNVDLPVIGKQKLSGLKRSEAIELIKEKLKAYVNGPTVLIRILNYKITVLGDVKNPGTFTIPNERITLPEALGIAGDVLITGKRKNILVIRDVDGKKTETRVDLTSKSLFSSPVYYLQQNDLVYVEPNRAKVNSSAVNTANVGLVVSIISLVVTISVLLFTVGAR